MCTKGNLKGSNYTILSKVNVMKKLVFLFIILISGVAISQTTVTLEDQCNCEVLSGTAVTTPGTTTPSGADVGDIYVNTNTGIIYFWDGDTWELTSSDNQQLQSFSFDSSTNELTLILENGGTISVDLSSLKDGGFDDQALTLTAGNVLTLEDGGTVDLTTFLDNTDDQQVTDFSLDSTTNELTLTLENGGTVTVDFTAILAVAGTDDQALSLAAGNILTLEDGGTVDLTAFLDNTDNQQVTDFSLDNTTNELTLTLENGGTVMVDFTAILAAAGTDDQALSLAAGNILTLEDGGTVDLTAFLDNTDNQQVTDFSLDSTTNELTITLENGGTVMVDFTAILAAAGTDDQNLTLTGNTLEIEDGNTVDLGGYLDNTDDQNLSLTGNTLTLEDGGTVDLSAYLDNTDDQAITDFSLDGATNIVTLTLEDGGTRTIDLSEFVSTDDQNLTLTGNTLEIENGNTVDLGGYLDNTDDQNISGSGLSGTDLTIGIENGTSETVDLSSLVGTDDQNLTLTGNVLTLEDGGTVDLSPYLDNTDDQAITDFSLDGATNLITLTLEDGGTRTIDLSGFLSTDDQNIEDLDLAGNILTVGIENGTAQTVDLSALDNAGTDDQNLTLTGNTLEIEDGNTVDLGGYLDNTDDQNLSLTGNTLTLEDGGTVDLSAYLDNTDDQAITDFSLDGTTNMITLTLEDGGTRTVDLSGFVSTDDQQISLTGNTLTLEDGGTVDLSPYLDNTDDQAITDFSLDGTTNMITLTLEDGGTRTIDLSGFVSTDDQNLTLTGNTLEIEDGNTVDLGGYLDNTDNQNLTLTGNVLTLEDGGTVDLTAFLDNTDNQQVTDFSLDSSTNELTLTLENGGTVMVDFTAILAAAGTDDQALSLAAGNILTLEDGGTVDLTAFLDNTDNQQVTDFSLDSTTNELTLTLENGGTVTVDFTAILAAADTNTTNNRLEISGSDLELEDSEGNILSVSLGALAAATDTDDQNLSLTGNTLTLEDGGTVDLSAYLDNTDDQAITDFSLDGTTNMITLTLEDGGTRTVDLSGFVSTDDQNIEDLGLAGNILTVGIENGTAQTVDLSALDNAGTDDQNLTLTGNTLEIEDGNTVDLSAYLDNTDDQNISGSGLSGTDLTIGIENGTSETVDLSSLVGTDDQTATEVAFTPTARLSSTNTQAAIEEVEADLNQSKTDAANAISANTTAINDHISADQDTDASNELNTAFAIVNNGTEDVLRLTDAAGNLDVLLNDIGSDDQNLTLTGNTLEIEDGNTVDLGGYLDNTDDQNLSLTGNTLTLEDGGTVDLSAYLDNTDDQAITDFSLDGTTNMITLTLEDGGTRTVDLSGFVSTDDQQISLTGNTLTLEDGGTVDLSPYLDNTDDQAITDFSLDGATNIVTLTLEDGGTRTVDLSGFVSTDDQQISLTGNTLTLEDGGTVDLSAFLDNTDNQTVTDFSIDNTTNVLTIALENGNTQTVDLSSLDNAGTDDQNLSTDGTPGNIAIEDGNVISLNVDDADADSTNEYNTAIGTDSGNLEITDNGGTLSTPLISSDANNDLGAGTDGALYLNVSSVTISETITDLSDSGDGSVTYVNESGATQKVAKADIVDNGDGTYTFTNNDGSDVLLDTRASGNPYDNSASGLMATDTQAALDELWSESSDNQNLTLTGNVLTLEDGGTVDLSAYLDNTDDQAITDFSLDGTTNLITLTLEDGGTRTIDLSGFVSTDDQNITLSGNTLTLEDGGTVDLSAYLDNTDDQAITDFSLDGTTNMITLTLEDGGTRTVDLSGFVSTDDQNIEDLGLAGNILTVGIENGTAQTVDLSALDNAGTDDQNLTLTGNTLEIEDGNTVDLSAYLDNTDDQNISGSGLSGTDLTIGIENGTSETVDLSSLVGTDDQTATEVAFTPTARLSSTNTQAAIEEVEADLNQSKTDAANAISANTTAINDHILADQDTDASNELNTAFAIVNNGTEDVLRLTDAAGNLDVLLNDIGSDDQNLTGASLNGSNILQIDIENGTSTTVDLSSLDNSGTDDQNLSLTGNTLTLEDGGTVDLSAYLDNTDDQAITDFSLDGATNIVTLTLEDGGTRTVDLSGFVSTDDQNLTLTGNVLTLEDGGTVDLSAYLDNTDDQAITDFSLDGATNMITLTLEDGGTRTIDLSGFVSTDDQNLTLTGNVLTLEDGGTVDLSAYLDNTDDQAITDFSLDGTTNLITLTLEDGGTRTIDLSGFVSTDDQNITLSGNTLTLEDGGTVDLSAYLDNTDDQAITDFSLDGTTNMITLTLEDGGTRTVDLSGFVSTDDQNLTLTGNTLEIEDGNTVDLSAYLDNTDDQNISGSGLSGTDLTIGIENGTSETVDLSSLVGTDDQTATEVAFTPTARLSSTNTQAAIEEVEADLNQSKTDAANAISANTTAINNHISADQDTDASNELNTAFAIVNNGTEDVLRLTDAAGNLDVLLNDIGSDDQNLTGASLNGSNILQIDIENGTSTTVDLSSLDNSGTDNQNIQNLALSGTTLTVGIQNGTAQTVDLASIDTDTDEQDLTGATLTGNILKIDIENGTSTTVDLSALNDNGTDNQTLIAGAAPGSLSISGGNSVTLNVNDSDSVIGNEYNTAFAVVGSNLRITDGGGNLDVPLSTIGTDDQFDDEVELRTPIDVDDAGKATVSLETNVQEVIEAIAPITSKAARIFYPPSIAVDASSNGTGRTIDLYSQYTAQFATPAVASTGAPASIPTYADDELYYYVTEYDTSVFDNVSVSATGVMTYDVISAPADYNSLINVVFVVK